MSLDLLSYIPPILHIITLCYVIICSALFTFKNAPSLLTMFFTFSMSSFLMSDLYWFSYTSLRPEVRMPFAANEIGEWATCLLMIAALSSVIDKRTTSPKSQIFFAWIFAAANTILWISWSGEWIQDIITGLVMGYFLCTLVHAEFNVRSFSKTELRYICYTAILMIIMQASVFFIPSAISSFINTSSYVLMSISIFYLYIKCIRTLKNPVNTKATLTLSFISFFWTTICLWMSDGFFYLIFLVSNMLMLPLMLEAMKQEAHNA